MEGSQSDREIQILETADDIEQRRREVLGRYVTFQDATQERRRKLEDARDYMYFRRDADELEGWILEKLQTASDESYKDPINLQAKIQKHQAFEAEVAAHANTISELDNVGEGMINASHYASVDIRVSRYVKIVLVVCFHFALSMHLLTL